MSLLVLRHVLLPTHGVQMSQPPRRSTVVRLAAFPETKEDLEKVLNVVAAWRSVMYVRTSLVSVCLSISDDCRVCPFAITRALRAPQAPESGP